MGSIDELTMLGIHIRARIERLRAYYQGRDQKQASKSKGVAAAKLDAKKDAEPKDETPAAGATDGKHKPTAVSSAAASAAVPSKPSAVADPPAPAENDEKTQLGETEDLVMADAAIAQKHSSGSSSNKRKRSGGDDDDDSAAGKPPSVDDPNATESDSASDSDYNGSDSGSGSDEDENEGEGEDEDGNADGKTPETQIPSSVPEESSVRPPPAKKRRISEDDDSDGHDTAAAPAAAAAAAPSPPPSPVMPPFRPPARVNSGSTAITAMVIE